MADQPGYEHSFGETLLEVKDLSVRYDGVAVLRGVNFAIQDIIRPGKTQGQVDALLAPSGMGKTQLFRCIAGLHAPDEGAVYINQQHQPVQVGMVGVVAQDYPLFAHLTVLDNLLMAAMIKHKDRGEATKLVMGQLDHFGLTDRRMLYPHQLSGGQRQRIAIIQQMVCSGRLLLMDEPFSGLDILMKDEVQQLIASVVASDDLNSVIITTHDIQSAIAVADTILLLGRERDAAGKVIPGASIRYKYNLMDLGLSWRPNIAELPQFTELEKEIRARFKEL
jgi:NitT/TauT family transport system ATP-binding protein